MCWNGLQIESLVDCDDLSGADSNCFDRRFFRLEGTTTFFEERLEYTVELRLCVIFFLWYELIGLLSTSCDTSLRISSVSGFS